MGFTLGSYGLGFLAGLLSTLSPCVLPILPIVLGGALAGHRFGPIALAAGLSLSFVGIGMFIALIGFQIGLDGEALRILAAAMLAVFGVVLISAALQRRLAAGAPSITALASRFQPEGLTGQFVLGILLGAAWSPCVGPTLGAAATLAAQRQSLGSVSLVMLLFGIGAALPLVLIGALSRGAMQRWRGRLLRAGDTGKKVLGALMIALAAIMIAGLDRQLEAALVNLSPAWLTDLTTRF